MKNQFSNKLFIISIITFAFSILFYETNFQKNPVMHCDEREHHINQSIYYSIGIFDKYFSNLLTTFPGPFLISGLYIKLIGHDKLIKNPKEINLMNKKQKIFLFDCRVLCFITYVLNVVLFALIESKSNSFFICISLFPYFFMLHFFFFTENYSVLFVTLYFLITKKTSNNIILFIVGFLTSLMRQTNICFLNFYPLYEVLCIISQYINDKNIKDFFNNGIKIIFKYLHIVVLDCLFIAFFIWNDYSIVLGDKSHHKISFNPLQMISILIIMFISFPKINLYFIDFIKRIINLNLKEFCYYFLFVSIILFYFNRFLVHHIYNYAGMALTRFYFENFFYIKKRRFLAVLYISIILTEIIIQNKKLLTEKKLLSCIIVCGLITIPEALMCIRYLMVCILFLCCIINSLNNENNEYLKLFERMFNKFTIVHLIIINGILYYLNYKHPIIFWIL